MTYDREEIRGLVEQLKQASIQAMGAGQFTRGVDLATAARALLEWLDQGMAGAMPVNAPALLAGQPEKAPAASLPVENVPEAQAPAVVEREGVTQPQDRASVPEFAAKPEPWVAPEDEIDRRLNALLEEARQKAVDGRYLEAEADMQTVVAQARGEHLRRAAQSALTQVETARQARLTELRRAAERVVREEPRNLERQREAWRALLAIEPGHRAALDALERLAERERLDALRKRIGELRVPSRAARKDIRAVEDARLKAHEILHGEEIADPDLRRELEAVYRELDELRNEILRASEGGASSERAQDFETAIERYRSALRAGYDVIVDDVTGDPIEVGPALSRTLQGYWTDLRVRSGRRYDEALRALEDGYPETAVGLLEEAASLMKKVEEGGEEIRRQVDEALARAREGLHNKQEAQRLVAEAESASHPEEGRVKLVQAKQHYPRYPDIDSMIAMREQLVLAQVVRTVAVDLSQARGALARREFETARGHCRTALQRGANLSSTSTELEEKRQEAQSFLLEIDASEKKRSELLVKLGKIDQALERESVRLVRNLLAQLNDEEQRDPEVGERRQRLTDLEEDDQKYAEAERLFFEEHDYREVIRICERLKDSDDFRDRARVLRRRAEARLWLHQAREAYQKGELEGAIAGYKRVEGLASELPGEDKPLVPEARDERRRSEAEQAKAKELRQHLRDVADLRLEDEVRWELWLGELKSLLSDAQSKARKPDDPPIGVEDLLRNAPVWLRGDVENEYKAGIEDWRDEAREKARRSSIRGEAYQAYDLLKPLADQHLLPSNDSLWNQVQYDYYRAEAKRLLGGYHDADWHDAERAIVQARDVAPADKLPEAQAAFLEVIRQAAIKNAALAATTANPGPEGAVQILEEKMNQYPILMRDGQMRGKLILYCLDLGDYDRALTQTHTMAYVPGEESVAPLWEQLVQGFADFASGRQVQGVASLVDIQRRGLEAGRASEGLQELHKHIVGKTLTQLRQAVGPIVSAVSNEEIVNRIQALDLMLQLDGNDQQAKAELKALSGRLSGLIRPLRERADGLRLWESLGQSLEEGEKLLAEMQSLLRACELVGQESVSDPLRRVEASVRSLVERWRSAARVLKDLGEQWSHSVTGTWEVRALQDLLDRARQSLTGEVTEITFWEKRVAALRSVVQDLETMLPAAEKAWKEEDFKGFVEKASALEGRLNEVRMTLDEKRFVIPEKRQTFYDPYTQEWLTGLSRLCQAARAKQANLDRWQRWSKEFKEKLAQALGYWQQVEQWIETEPLPPCLTRSLEHLAQLELDLAELRAQVEEQPQQVLSGKAKDIASGLSGTVLIASLEERQQQAREKREWVEAQLKKVEEPLDRVHKFVRKGRPLSNRRNREALRRFLDDVKAIDGCHPEVEEYENLLRRYGE